MTAEGSGGATAGGYWQAMERKDEGEDWIPRLRRTNAALQLETEMFERYLNRLNPVSKIKSESYGAQSQKGHEWHSKRWTSVWERLPLLTVEQKCEVAQWELEQVKEELEKDKARSERALSGLRVSLEEAEIRLVEIKKARSEFERNIIKAVQEKRGPVLGAEKLICYFEDKIKAKDTLIEKLRLINAALKVHKRKLQMQLRQKEEMGEALHRVDFQKLEIENSQCLELISERNQELLHFKLMAGKVAQVLSSHKKKLQDATFEAESLDRDIASRRQMLEKIQAEMVLVEKECSKVDALNRKLRKHLEEYRVPDVLQYIQVTMAYRKLEQSVRNWERKTEIAQMALKTHTKGYKRRTADEPGPVLTH